LPAPIGHLTVEQVTVTVEGRKEPVLRQIKFKLEAGESLAIVGASASGKSTLARVILGLVNPNMGEVRLDNADLQQWPRDKLGQYVGYLPQDVELFEGTLPKILPVFKK
jgi:ABC-type protease/lipase transport system fused ATPase/permease subunit